MPDYQEGSSSVNNALPLSSEEIQYPLVSVVIVNYNGMKFLKECLDSIARQTYPCLEIIVVDNASTDNSAEFLLSYPREIEIIKNPSNLGFSGGVNIGVQRARGSFIMTLNTDAKADFSCIEHLVSGIESDDRIGMCATKMLFTTNRINSTGICISRSGAAWDRGMDEVDNGQQDTSREILGPSAGAALYRKIMLDDIGFFDEDFFIYLEDVDLAFRAQLAGWKCIYVPAAVVYHVRGGTAGYKSDLSVYYGNRNVLWWPVKNFPSGLLFLSSPLIIGRAIGVIPYYIIKGQAKIIIKSKIDSLSGLPKMFRKRKTVKQRVPTKNMMKFLNRWH